MQKTVLNSLILQQGRDVMSPWQIPLFSYLQECYRWLLSYYGDGFVCFRGPSGHLFNDKELLVSNPLFPHQSKILTLRAESDSAGLLASGIAFDRKNGGSTLIFWGKISDDRVVTFVYTFKEGLWKTIRGCNGSGKDFYSQGCAQLVNERFLCWLCTDLISSVNRVLVFDVEEEMWKDPIPLGEEHFSVTVQHEKQLCVISRRYEQRETIFELWKIDLKQRVLQLLEFIPLPSTGETEWGDRYMLRVDEWSPGFFRVEEWKTEEGRYCTWVYDISQHSWQRLGHIRIGYVCFEGSLFRLAV